MPFEYSEEDDAPADAGSFGDHIAAGLTTSAFGWSLGLVVLPVPIAFASPTSGMIAGLALAPIAGLLALLSLVGSLRRQQWAIAVGNLVWLGLVALSAAGWATMLGGVLGPGSTE